MKKFNLNRFWQVFKRLMLVRSSTTLYTFLGLAAATFFILLGFTSPFTMKPMTNGELFFGIIQAFESITMCFSIGYFFFVSNIMSDLQRRQDRIGEIMLPATNLEKFVARILYVSIGYLVLCIAANRLYDHPSRWQSFFDRCYFKKHLTYGAQYIVAIQLRNHACIQCFYRPWRCLLPQVCMDKESYCR